MCVLIKTRARLKNRTVALHMTLEPDLSPSGHQHSLHCGVSRAMSQGPGQPQDVLLRQVVLSHQRSGVGGSLHDDWSRRSTTRNRRRGVGGWGRGGGGVGGRRARRSKRGEERKKVGRGRLSTQTHSKLKRLNLVGEKGREEKGKN